MRKLFPHLMAPAAIAVIVGSSGGFAKLDGWLFWLAFSLPCGLGSVDNYRFPRLFAPKAASSALEILARCPTLLRFPP